MHHDIPVSARALCITNQCRFTKCAWRQFQHRQQPETSAPVYWYQKDYFGENIYPGSVAESLVRFTCQMKNLVVLILYSECSIPWLIISPLTNFESACGKSVLPAVLIILRVENSVFVFFWSDVLLPLFLAVAVFTTKPTMIASLGEKKRRFNHNSTKFNN